jgi:hypothetical protein
MSRMNNTIWCDGCGLEIIWLPLVISGRHYCCQECMRGLACQCYRWSELDEERRVEDAGARSPRYSDIPNTY